MIKIKHNCIYPHDPLYFHLSESQVTTKKQVHHVDNYFRLSLEIYYFRNKKLNLI